MTESMQRLIISARPTNEISVKGPAGQSLSTNDLTNILSASSTHLLNYSLMKNNTYEVPMHLQPEINCPLLVLFHGSLNDAKCI